MLIWMPIIVSSPDASRRMQLQFNQGRVDIYYAELVDASELDSAAVMVNYSVGDIEHGFVA